LRERQAASDQLFNRNEVRHLSSFPHPGGFAAEPERFGETDKRLAER